jgi:hypothetical protein
MSIFEWWLWPIFPVPLVGTPFKSHGEQDSNLLHGSTILQLGPFRLKMREHKISGPGLTEVVHTFTYGFHSTHHQKPVIEQQQDAL